VSERETQREGLQNGDANSGRAENGEKREKAGG